MRIEEQWDDQINDAGKRPRDGRAMLRLMRTLDSLALLHNQRLATPLGLTGEIYTLLADAFTQPIRVIP